MSQAELTEDSPTAARAWAAWLWCVVAAFGTYFCTYAFRKPFTAADYSDAVVWGLGFKAVLVAAQVCGYTLSKFLGIKVVAEVRPQRRAALLLALVALAELALVLFGLTPVPFNLVWLFANGLALGIVFGLVLGFLEGRRQTEALTAGLCCSFIVADGVVKSAGAALLNAGVSEYWMPSLAGLLFAPPLVVCVWMLSRIGPPSRGDVLARSERAPMDRRERWAMFRRYAPGLVLLMLVYLLITVLRSARADFAAEIWRGLLGSPAAPGDFSWSEIAVAAGVTALLGTASLIRDNRRAFFAGLAVAGAGAVLLAAALAGRMNGALSPFAFMVSCGLGLYLPYVAVHTIIFERLIAMTRDRGNIGYLMYLVDAFGYLGYVAVLLGRNLFAPGDEFLGFFLSLCWVIAAACLVLLVPCWLYFAGHPATRPALQGGAP